MRLIDADRALEIVRDQGIAHPNAYHLTNYATLILQEAPTIEAKPVVYGEIIETIEKGKMKRVFSCCNTVCTQLTMWLEPNYCPNCGADMRERKET